MLEQPERNGFEQLMRENERVVFQIAFGVLGDASEAQDVTQDAFVQAYAKLASLREPGRFRAWVCTIGRRMALNRLRGNVRALEREALATKQPAREIDVSAVVEEREFVARVRREIDRLPEKLRAVILLSAVDGLQPAEVAAVLGIPPGTVRSRLHLARKQLLRTLS
jgi:RNA polymerase sigma-70 factor (ECF subfamily)